MGGYAARKCDMLLTNISRIMGIELMLCQTAISIIGGRPSEGLNSILEAVNQTIEPLKEDRYFGLDIEKAAQLVLRDLQRI